MSRHPYLQYDSRIATKTLAVLYSGYDCFVTEREGSQFQTCLSMAFGGQITTYECPNYMLDQPGSTATVNVPLTTFSAAVETDAYSETKIIVAPSRSSTRTVSSTTTYTNILSAESPILSLFAPMVQLNWKDEDRAEFSRILASTAATSNTTLVESAVPTSALASTQASGLSTSGKIAIGAIVPFIVLAASGLLGFAVYRWRARKHRKMDAVEHRDKPELDASNTAKKALLGGQLAELTPSVQVHEADNGARHELEAPNVTHEIGDSRPEQPHHPGER